MLKIPSPCSTVHTFWVPPRILFYCNISENSSGDLDFSGAPWDFLPSSFRNLSKNYLAVSLAISSQFLPEFLWRSSKNFSISQEISLEFLEFLRSSSGNFFKFTLGIFVGAPPGILWGFLYHSSSIFFEIYLGILQSSSSSFSEIFEDSIRNSYGVTPK